MKRIMTLRSACGAVVLLALAAAAAQAEEKIRVACVGDSITFGAGVEERAKNHYPRKLGELLGEKYEVRNFGNSGATLLKEGDKPYWNLPEFKAATEFRPQIVVIKLGTNDTKPQNWKHADQFAADLAAMVEHFQQLESRPQVYLCKPVPVYETRWGINEKDLTEGVIPKVEAVAKEKKCEVIDLYKALSDKPEWFPDKIHPNAAGAAAMARAVHEAIAGQD